MKTTTNTKAERGIRYFLEHRGFEIIEDGWAHGKDAIDYIARDGENGDLVFVSIAIHCDADDGFPADGLDRKAAERIAAAYLAQTDVEPGMIRFDIVSMLVLNDSRGMIRHYRNALSEVA